jgi:class 3 adenylate cyclase/transcriptional regulator with XRE-family HTH domain/tetratricopeptide (TPR) repeat protein
MTESKTVGEHPVAGEVRTFLIADVRGYTQFTIERGDEAAARLTQQFADLATAVAAARDGRVIEVRGDEALAVFSSARQALRAAVDLQTRLAQESMPQGVGIGLDAGEAVPVTGGYRGAALNLAARLCSLAAPGEVLASEGVIHLARKVEGLAYLERGQMTLKGFTEPVGVLQVVLDDQDVARGFQTSAAPVPRFGPTAFGTLLHRHRLAAELTQEALAERAHLSARAISDLERGAKTRPHRITVELLADALDLTTDDRAALVAALPSRAVADAGDVPDLPIGGFLGSLPEGPLVARDRELEDIVTAIDAAIGGAGQLLVLAGEPGAGKTRLAQEATLVLRRRGCLLATGRCYEPQQAVAYYPFLEALSTVYTAAPPAIRAEAARRWPSLGRLLPDQIGQATGASQGADDQQRLFRTVTDFIVALAKTVPVALLIDDLHWADGATLDLLQHLARHSRSERVLLLGTYRDVEVGRQHPLRQVVRDLNREHLVERIAVRRLDQEGTAALLAVTLDEEHVSKEFAALVHRQTEGNPFFVHEVVQALMERGDIYREDGRWERRQLAEIEVPESVRDVIGERLSRLREQTQVVLCDASVLGSTFGFDDLQAVTGQPEQEVEHALDEAVEAGLLRPLERDDYTFNHALTQQTLYAELSPRRRRRLHRVVGEALEQRPAARRTRNAAELAWHFLQADDPERAVVYALMAGDGAEAVFAHREAERHYRTALELARELGDPTREAEALEKLGAVLGVLTRYDEALAFLARAAQQCRLLDDVAGEMRVAVEIGIAERGRGTAARGIEQLESVVERFRACGPSRELAILYATLERLYIVVGRYADELTAAERASELARRATTMLLLSLRWAGARHSRCSVNWRKAWRSWRELSHSPSDGPIPGLSGGRWPI